MSWFSICIMVLIFLTAGGILFIAFMAALAEYRERKAREKRK